MNGIPRDSIVLSVGKAEEWKFSAIGDVRVVEGVPRQKFRKDIIRIGEFRKDSQDLDFEIQGSHLDHWVKVFASMRANGVKVPIPAAHEGEGDPDKNRGYVEAIFRNDDRLVMLCEMIGEDGIKAASRNDVSVKIEKSLVDGSGNRYELPITHVALCPDPVILGLGEFIPVAASKNSNGETNMKWDGIEKGLGIEGLTDENAQAKILALFSESEKVSKAGIAEIGTALSLSGEVTKENVLGSIATLQTKAKAPAVPADYEPDPELLRLSKQNKETMLKELELAGKIDPDTGKKLRDMYLTDEAMTLSLSNGTSSSFDVLAQILAGNAAVLPGGLNRENTGPQLLSMNDPAKIKNEDNGADLCTEMKSRSDK